MYRNSEGRIPLRAVAIERKRNRSISKQRSAEEIIVTANKKPFRWNFDFSGSSDEEDSFNPRNLSKYDYNYTIGNTKTVTRAPNTSYNIDTPFDDLSAAWSMFSDTSENGTGYSVSRGTNTSDRNDKIFGDIGAAWSKLSDATGNDTEMSEPYCKGDITSSISSQNNRLEITTQNLDVGSLRMDYQLEESKLSLELHDNEIVSRDSRPSLAKNSQLTTEDQIKSILVDASTPFDGPNALNRNENKCLVSKSREGIKGEETHKQKDGHKDHKTEDTTKTLFFQHSRSVDDNFSSQDLDSNHMVEEHPCPIPEAPSPLVHLSPALQRNYAASARHSSLKKSGKKQAKWNLESGEETTTETTKDKVFQILTLNSTPATPSEAEFEQLEMSADMKKVWSFYDSQAIGSLLRSSEKTKDSGLSSSGVVNVLRKTTPSNKTTTNTSSKNVQTSGKKERTSDENVRPMNKSNFSSSGRIDSEPSPVDHSEKFDSMIVAGPGDETKDMGVVQNAGNSSFVSHEKKHGMTAPELDITADFFRKLMPVAQPRVAKPNAKEADLLFSQLVKGYESFKIVEESRVQDGPERKQAEDSQRNDDEGNDRHIIVAHSSADHIGGYSASIQGHELDKCSSTSEVFNEINDTPFSRVQTNAQKGREIHPTKENPGEQSSWNGSYLVHADHQKSWTHTTVDTSMAVPLGDLLPANMSAISSLSFDDCSSTSSDSVTTASKTLNQYSFPMLDRRWPHKQKESRIVSRQNLAMPTNDWLQNGIPEAKPYPYPDYSISDLVWNQNPFCRCGTPCVEEKTIKIP